MINKNLKRIIAITLAVGIISAVLPNSKVNLLTSKVYASSSNTTTTLSSLTLETSGNSTITLYSDSNYSTQVSSSSVTKGTTYYATSSSKADKISISGPDSKYVKVFKGTSSSTEGKNVDSNISLSSGTTTLVVRVYDEKPDSNIKYSKDSHVVSEYTIKVKYSGSSSDNNNDDELDSLRLETSSGDTIKLYDDDDYDSDNKVDSSDVESNTDYYAKTASTTVNVNISGVSSKYVRVFKDHGDDISDSIKGKKASNDITLSSGTNTIVVRVYDDEPDDDIEYEDDDDKSSDYTIYVKCASDSSSDSNNSTYYINSNSGVTVANSTPDTATTISNTKIIGWAQVNGRWQYYNYLGKQVINQWIFDGNYNKWYYLDSNGFMVTNTTINGYTVGADGAWIK